MALWLYRDPFEHRSALHLDPEDFLSTLIPRELHPLLQTQYCRPWRSLASQQDLGSTVNFDKDKFQANLDVQQFKPEEITVKVTGDNTVTVEGKHEEKEDEHGFISRHFVRRYVLPKGHDINKIESKLSDGVLTITAPKINAKGEEQHRNIPIVQTGKPTKAVEEKKEEKEKK